MNIWLATCLLVAFFFSPISVFAQARAPNPAAIGRELRKDGSYLADNIQLDLEDIATSPLYIAAPDSPLRSRRFYLEVAGAGALWGVSFALDKSMQSGVGHMAHSAHDIMENLSYVGVVSAAGLLYLSGLYHDDERARDYALTGAEAAGMGVLFNLGIKAIFGRLRPYQSRSHTAFFDKVGNFNASSFTSNDMVIITAMATGVSEYYSNRWYIAAPLYSLAMVEGFTRMGSDQNWLSDVVAGGLLGWSTAELLLWLHKKHAIEPDRWRIAPMAPAPVPTSGGARAIGAAGVGIAYSW
jgi:membrane-associated phospholipid phosphatase